MTSKEWYLEGYLDGPTKALRRVRVLPLPFRIGRSHDSNLVLNEEGISKRHAELFDESGQLCLRDLESKNGTFLKRSRLEGAAPLEHGDVVHFGKVEMRVVAVDVDLLADVTMVDAMHTMELSRQFPTDTREFLELLRTGAVAPHYQPIVRIQDGSGFGHEVLGRGAMDGLPKGPGDLFALAAALEREAELSRLFRIKGLIPVNHRALEERFFVNTHPAEMNDGRIVESLKELRRVASSVRVVVEIHETMVTAPKEMRELRAALTDLDMMLAYDDFGAGQARLVELSEVPPDFLKFDIALCRGIHEAPESRQAMVQSLVRMATDLGVPSLAEGVEDAADAEVCRDLGFEFGQGYFWGKPVPLSALS